MQTLKLVGLKRYTREKETFEQGVLYTISDEKADTLLELVDPQTETNYFALATPKEIKAAQQAKAAARAARSAAADDAEEEEAEEEEDDADADAEVPAAAPKKAAAKKATKKAAAKKAASKSAQKASNTGSALAGEGIEEV